jgi:two-component system cell cycle response regulator
VSLMKVLIADDSIVSRHLLAAALRKADYEVISACDGAEAWALLEEDDAPKLVILDWMMPGLTGLEVCQRIRQQARESYTYILVLTSRNGREDLIAGMDAGADDYITKPFDQQELQVRLRAGQRILKLHAQLLEAREALREQATRDALTKVWNRSAIFEILERELSRGHREGAPVGIVLVDFDQFKAVNDTHGHLAGDAVLREAAQRLVGTLRPYDSVGRYGGEEFLVILPGCDAEGTRKQAERMRSAIMDTPMEIKGGTVRQTASFGATVAEPGALDSSEALIHAADDALYRAKARGRNHVVFRGMGSEIEKEDPDLRTVAR